MTERVAQGDVRRPSRAADAPGGATPLVGPPRGLSDNLALSVKPRSAGAHPLAPRRAFDPATEPSELSGMVTRVNCPT